MGREKRQTRFDYLSSLYKGDESAKEFFSSLRIYAILIPGSDSRKLSNILSESADKIVNGLTIHGLFISYTDEPRNWYRIRQGTFPTEFPTMAFPNGRISRKVIESLQMRLSLPEQSCIILSSDLNSNEYVILPTYNKKTEERLIQIGEYFRYNGNSLEELVKIFKGLEDKPYYSSTENGQSLLRNLTDIEAILAMTGLEEDRESAKQWIKDTLDNLKKAYAVESEEDEVDPDAISRYDNYLALAAEIPSRSNFCLYKIPLNVQHDFREIRTFNNEISFDDYESELSDKPRGQEPKRPESEKYYIKNLKGIENASRRALVNYNDLLPHFFDEDNSIKSQWNEFDDIPVGDSPYDLFEDDYFTRNFAPLVNYLAHVMEEELNASVIQLMRTYYLIQMPQFYRLFDSCKDYCPVYTKKKTINFNERGKVLGDGINAVKMIMLGELGVCLGYHNADSKWESQPWESHLDIFEDGQFVQLLKQFSDIRNKAAHSGAYVSKDGFIDFFVLFSSIMDTYYPKMLELKMQLRNHPARIEKTVSDS